MKVRLKILCTICDPKTLQGLPITQPYDFQVNIIWCECDSAFR
jgi:hypothetical protein